MPAPEAALPPYTIPPSGSPGSEEEEEERVSVVTGQKKQERGDKRNWMEETCHHVREDKNDMSEMKRVWQETKFT